VPAFKCCVREKEEACAFYGILLFPSALLFLLRQRCQTGLFKEMEAKLSLAACVQKAAVAVVPKSVLCFVFCSASVCTSVVNYQMLFIENVKAVYHFPLNQDVPNREIAQRTN